MTGWPVNKACTFFKDFPEPPTPEEEKLRALFADTPLTDDEKKNLKAIYDSTNVYFNNESKPEICTDISDTEGTGELDGAGWDVLACN